MDPRSGGFAVTDHFFLAILGAQHICLHYPTWPLLGAKFAVINQRSGGFAMTDQKEPDLFVVMSLKDQKVADLLYLVL